MEIYLKSTYGYDLIFKAENVEVTEDIEDRIYPIGENGKKDFSKPCKRDISDSAMEQITRLLSDMLDYRDREFDSSYLISQLFSKLPDEEITKLLNQLNKYYPTEQ